MKIKSIMSITLSLATILTLSACNKTGESDLKRTTAATSIAQQKTTSNYAMNPLTGLYNLDKDMIGKRPVAVMINNINVAKPVQTSVGDADMVFETMVEGGITRLLAVYSDITKIDQIGSVRSARYSYAELACGLDAVFVHCGSDNTYATPLMKSLGMDHLDLDANASSAGERRNNGLSSEHRMYTFGDKLYNIYKNKRTDIKQRAQNVYTFNDEKSPTKYDQAATDISVYFSGYYKTTFSYDESKGKYSRGSKSILKDYKTGDTEQFKNVFILYANIYAFDDQKHMKTDFSSGYGVYITEGTSTNILWSKGSSSSSLEYFAESGKKLSINAGNSYICLTSTSNKSNTTIS